MSTVDFIIRATPKIAPCLQLLSVLHALSVEADRISVHGGCEPGNMPSSNEDIWIVRSPEESVDVGEYISAGVPGLGVEVTCSENWGSWARGGADKCRIG